jgi:hypothetical protein
LRPRGWLKGAEADEALGRLQLRLDAGDHRRRGPMPAPFDQALDGTRVTFSHHLDAAIGEVTGPTGQPEKRRLLSTGAAVPDTLDPPLHPDVPADHVPKLARAARPQSRLRHAPPRGCHPAPRAGGHPLRGANVCS